MSSIDSTDCKSPQKLVCLKKLKQTTFSDIKVLSIPISYFPEFNFKQPGTHHYSQYVDHVGVASQHQSK